MIIKNNTPASLNQRQSLLISSGEIGAYCIWSLIKWSNTLLAKSQKLFSTPENTVLIDQELYCSKFFIRSL